MKKSETLTFDPNEDQKKKILYVTLIKLATGVIILHVDFLTWYGQVNWDLLFSY